ncbi:DUF2851 family protein [Sinomicrobium weinanense]|uniref:DUF2851 family protein n=1 Tax=Sinomicrobium weinanense TaxID=2842200 RepID=A0A926JSE1_9FLAO|nr:DUF2851 family protein [Sinomicrobium weinanense]MBC9796504.1 DUF2851 family protein [Sinomicrobium weinanense]MBU3123520.1 DUF2851 family protein [Sinomicrobium weinanense]
MKEDFLHYLWKFQKFHREELYTSSREKVEVIATGQHNGSSGPDFFNAKLRIGGQLWAGNVEIHLKSSDWYVHHHEKDMAYDNVVLHVVWEDDMPVFRKDNSAIPALELKAVVPEGVWRNYTSLLKGSYDFINCEKEIGKVDPFLRDNYLERLFFERLEQKSLAVLQDLESSRNDWEAVFFKNLTKNFGLKVNGESFRSIADSISYNTVRKVRSDLLQLEALLFGQAGLLENTEVPDSYTGELHSEYIYLKKKYQLSGAGVIRPLFHKLRPANFPTLRLSQLANLYVNQGKLFAAAMEAGHIREFYDLFDSTASAYWDRHYVFGKVSGKKRSKNLSGNFIDLLMINTVIPLKFCYARHTGRDANAAILEIMESLKPEKNRVTDRFATTGIKARNAGESQALLQLYNTYCSKNRCLECVIGHHLLKN